MSTERKRRPPQMFEGNDPAVQPSAPQQSDRDLGDETQEHFERGPQHGGSDDHTDGAEATAKQPQNGGPVARGVRWGGLLFAALSGLALLAAGVWFARFAAVALARNDWVGWTAQALLGLALLAALVIAFKEFIGLLRMARISRIRRDADHALASADRTAEERAVKALKGLARGRSDNTWRLSAFRDEERHMRGPGELLGLADRVLLAVPDLQARRIVFESARRVAIVAAVVPITFLVVMFVFAENVRMVRRLAAAYGGRPGALGGVRLLWRVIMHVAATGAIALTDDLFGQFLGQDIVRRISRRLGEGAFIGALTARLGVAAIEVCRPLPYIEAAPLRSRHVVRELFPEINPAKMVKSAFSGKPDSQTRND